jgi:hypothetical protein
MKNQRPFSVLILNNKQSMKRTFPFQSVTAKILRFTMILMSLLVLCSSLSYPNPNVGSEQDLMDQKVSINVHSRTMRRVLLDIEKQTNVKFVYSNATIKPEDRVTIAFTSEKLSTVLNKLFEPLSISYSLIGSRILLRKTDNRTGSL